MDEGTYELTDGQTDRPNYRLTDRRTDKETSYHRQNIKDLFNQTIFITYKVYALLSLIIEIHLTCNVNGNYISKYMLLIIVAYVQFMHVSVLYN